MSAITFNKVGSARSFAEIMHARRSGNPRGVKLTKSQLEDMISTALKRHGLVKTVETAATPKGRTVSDIDQEIEDHAIAKALSGEGLPAAMGRLAAEGDAKLSKLYAERRDAAADAEFVSRVAKISGAMGRLDDRDAAIAEMEAIIATYEKSAHAIRERDPKLSQEQAMSLAVDSDKEAYGRYLLAQQRASGATFAAL